MSLTRATIPVFVPFVNRPDLLKLCIDSLSIRLTTEPVIINNSGKELPPEFHHHTIVTPENPADVLADAKPDAGIGKRRGHSTSSCTRTRKTTKASSTSSLTWR